MITITINGKKIKTEEGRTILEVARDEGIHIPNLCSNDALKPAGNCRLCSVEVTQGDRTTIETSCNYLVQEGMKVATETERVKDVRKLVMELLLARCPNPKIQPGERILHPVRAVRPHLRGSGAGQCH